MARLKVEQPSTGEDNAFAGGVLESISKNETARASGLGIQWMLAMIFKRMPSFVRLTVIFAFVHWLLLCTSSMVVMGRGVHRLDHPEFPVTTVERLCMALTSVLQQPYESFVHATHFPGGWVSIVPGILTSLLWGAVAASVLVLTGRFLFGSLPPGGNGIRHRR